MKIGILTFPNSVSHGACLQMIALQDTVRRLGHEVEILNYHNPFMKTDKHTRKGRHPLKCALQWQVRRLMHRRLYANFARFERRQANHYPARPFTDKKKLTALGQRYDAVICGSDQVWNPYITGGDLSYFLDFCDADTKRVAYAPSFGVEAFPDGFMDSVTTELERFHALSAREQSGKELVERLTDRTAPLVVDPTWLVDADRWAQMETVHPAAQGDYVLYFVVHQSKELLARCRAFAKERGLRVVVIGGNPIIARKNTDPMLTYATDVAPDQWLYLMHNARYVFTNSFHGTAFSVLFERDVYVQVPPRSGSRVLQVLKNLGMEHCEVRSEEALSDRPVDYDYARTVFARLRADSIAYLENALK